MVNTLVTEPDEAAATLPQQGSTVLRLQYEHILDNILEGCQIIDTNYRYLYINDVASKQDRIDKQRLMGHTMMESYPGIESTELFARIRDCMEQRTTHNMEYEFTFPDASKEWFEVTMHPIPEGLLILSLSIADSKKLTAKEAAYDKEQAALAAIVESSEDAIIGKTLDGVVTSWNRSAERMYGYAPHEMIGNSISTIVPPDHPDEVPEILKKIRRGTSIKHFETVRVRKDGTRITVSLSISPIRSAKGTIVGAATIARDVTERKKLEAAEAKLQLVTALQAANKELEAFSYSVSHDLRAPLRAIDGFSKILSEDYADKLDDDGQHVIATIRHSTEQMGELIDDLLAFSRLGRQPIKAEDTNMTELAKTVFDDLKLANPGRDIRFCCEALPNAQVDASLIREVWVNLLANAVKYTKKKLIATITVSGKTTSDEKIYYVNDDGVGFDMKYVDKLFGVFQRLHSPEDFEGTGVGLAIVARIVAKHGGRVWAKGEVDKGATFYFSFPRLSGVAP